MKYKTILADPPWRYDNARTGGSMKSGAEHHYPVMNIEEICKLGQWIQGIADKNCVLFMWITSSKLNEVWDVIRDWGFQYKTSMIWVKTRILGMGFWFRVQYELCLICTMGKPKPFYCSVPNIFFAPVTRHSRKPERFFQLIDPLIERPAIELFAREKREEWDVWGEEVNDELGR